MKESEQTAIFNSWLLQYKALLFKVIRAYAFTADDRDDLFQEIVLQVWKSVPRFRHESAVSTWLYRISLNTAMRWISGEKKYRANNEDIEVKKLPAEALLEEKSTAEDERLAWLYHEIGRLKEIDRSIALLLLDGLSYKEISDIVGLSETNIGVRIFRIKQHLTTQSKKYNYHGI